MVKSEVAGGTLKLDQNKKSFQTNPQANAWWVKLFWFSWKNVFFETPQSMNRLRTLVHVYILSLSLPYPNNLSVLGPNLQDINAAMRKPISAGPLFWGKSSYQHIPNRDQWTECIESVLHQDAGGIGKSIPYALEIFLGRGFCTPRPSGFPSGFALGKIPWVSGWRKHPEVV